MRATEQHPVDDETTAEPLSREQRGERGVPGRRPFGERREVRVVLDHDAVPGTASANPGFIRSQKPPSPGDAPPTSTGAGMPTTDTRTRPGWTPASASAAATVSARTPRRTGTSRPESPSAPSARPSTVPRTSDTSAVTRCCPASTPTTTPAVASSS
ncbi:hypothetical protein P9139_19715 [Curtobacterium flaccumfaciens]|nr:hypothetical protein P9139_19715 [Curtobacterium flaccumfaciens]